MIKKISCLLLVALLLLSFGTMSFAADYFDSIDTTAKMQIAKTESGISAASGNSISVTKRDSEAFPKFDYRCTLNMKNVRDKYTFYYTNWKTVLGYTNTDPVRLEQLNKQLEGLHITGEFTIEITYPKSFVVPAEFFENGKMAGFDNNAKLIFGNDVRTLTEGPDNNTLTITVEVVGKEAGGNRPGYVVAKDLYDNLDTYLSDLTLTCVGAQTTQYGTFEVSGKMTGFTLVQTAVNSGPLSLKVDYQTNPEKAYAYCTILRKGYSSGGDDDHTVTFDEEGVDPIEVEDGGILHVEDLEIPYKDGYSFDGWYTDEELTQKVTEDLVITKDITLYPKWVKNESADKLNAGDHFAYIVGYPEGDVRPENNIDREEITTVFFRLLLDEVRDPIYCKENSFSDVEADRWSNNAISTMQNGGYVTGYEDGSFRPDEYITRAEFATIASHMDTMNEDATHRFSDVSGHWAEKYIADAVSKGWIAGYEDGTFRPDEYITRAEAMTIINRMLLRFVNEEGLHADAIKWPDNAKTAWYYYAVEEATNSHNYERQADGVYETWTELTPNRDWFELER